MTQEIKTFPFFIRNDRSVPLRQWWVSHLSGGLTQSAAGTLLNQKQTMPAGVIQDVRHEDDYWSFYFINAQDDLEGIGFDIEMTIPFDLDERSVLTIVIGTRLAGLELSGQLDPLWKRDLHRMSTAGAAKVTRKVMTLRR